MIRRLVVVVLALVVVLVAADRVAEAVAARLVADRTQAAAGLAHRPSVTIAGFPFLTQALRGRYQQVDVTAHQVPADGLTFATVSARLSDVRLDLGSALRGTIAAIPVGSGRGSAELQFSELDAYASAHRVPVTVSAASDGQVRVTGSVSVLGQRLSAGADGGVRISAGQLLVSPFAQTLRGLTSALPSAVSATVLSALTLRVPLGQLPFGITLTGVRVSSGGLSFTATSSGLDIPVRAAGLADPAGGVGHRPS